VKNGNPRSQHWCAVRGSNKCVDAWAQADWGQHVKLSASVCQRRMQKWISASVWRCARFAFGCLLISTLPNVLTLEEPGAAFSAPFSTHRAKGLRCRGYIDALTPVDANKCESGLRVILSPDRACEEWAQQYVGRIGTLRERQKSSIATNGIEDHTRWKVTFKPPNFAGAATAGEKEDAVEGYFEVGREGSLVTFEEGVGKGSENLTTWEKEAGYRRAASWGSLGEALLVLKSDKFAAQKALRIAYEALPRPQVAQQGTASVTRESTATQTLVRGHILFRCAQFAHKLDGDVISAQRLFEEALALQASLKEDEEEDEAGEAGGEKGKKEKKEQEADLLAAYGMVLISLSLSRSLARSLSPCVC
jgi:hypothetical protein